MQIIQVIDQLFDNICSRSSTRADLADYFFVNAIARPHVLSIQSKLHKHDNLKKQAGGDQFSSKVTGRPFSPSRRSPLNFHISNFFLLPSLLGCLAVLLNFLKKLSRCQRFIDCVESESRAERSRLCCRDMEENVRILKTTVMTFVVKLDPPGPFLINSLVDVAINEWNSNFVSETVKRRERSMIRNYRKRKTLACATHLCRWNAMMTVNKWSAVEAEWQLNKHRFHFNRSQFLFFIIL